MSFAEQHRKERRARDHNATRASILDAARRVADREGARNLSLRGAAAEAGYTPAALYGYFRNKDELLLALAADDLAGLARTLREAARAQGGGLAAASAAALDLLENTETIAAASTALPQNGSGSGSGSEMERLFNGRLIAVLTALSETVGEGAKSREAQADVLLVAATLSGLALLSRAGRLEALGFDTGELLARLEARFAND